MRDDQSDPSARRMPLSEMKAEPGVEDLLDSAAMEPYVKLALAVMGRKDTRPAVKELTALPLEKRYTWRVASALKWAFADFENLNVAADRRTLCQEDLDKIVELVRIRPVQFCMFLAALFGEDRMEMLISSSVAQVKLLREKRRETLGHEPGVE